MIVSASPIFQDVKEELIAQGNKCSKIICYPLQIYENAKGKNKPKKGDRLIGPKLATAYYDLAIKVGFVLAKNKRAGLDPAKW